MKQIIPAEKTAQKIYISQGEKVMFNFDKTKSIGFRPHRGNK